MTKRGWLRLLIVVTVLAAAGGGFYWWWSSRHQKAENVLVLYGNVDIRQVELAINGSERIAILRVEEGDHIKKGQLLARLETIRLEYAVARAKAQVASQQQVVARLEAGSRPEEIRKAKADVEAAVAKANDAKVTLRRIELAFKKGAVTQQDVDDARTTYESNAAQVKSLEANRDLVIAGPRKEDIAQAKATLKQYEAELDQAEHDLQDASLYAPEDGIVQDRLLEVGDMASPSKPVYLIALTKLLWIRAYVSEPDLGKIREGMRAIVTTDSFPGKEYEGWVGFISPTAEFTPKPVETLELRTKLVYQVRVFVNNPKGELRLGMPATVTIRLDQPMPDVKGGGRKSSKVTTDGG